MQLVDGREYSTQREKYMQKPQTGASLEHLKNTGKNSVAKAERSMEEEPQLMWSERW